MPWSEIFFRAHRFALIAVALLPVSAFSDQGSNGRVEVVPHGWGGAELADIHAVLESASDSFSPHLGGRLIPSILIFYSEPYPIVLHERSKDGKVQIGLSVGDTYWSAYAFQFSHEYVHLLVRHTSPRKTEELAAKEATWFEEVLCETGSLFALRSMSDRWSRKPPYPNWRSYSPSLREYAEQRIRQARSKYPEAAEFSEWFSKNSSALKEDAYNRELNTIIAANLLPIFEEHPNAWEALLFYFDAGIESSDNAEKIFSKWERSCPPRLRPAVSKLAGVFGV